MTIWRACFREEERRGWLLLFAWSSGVSCVPGCSTLPAQSPIQLTATFHTVEYFTRGLSHTPWITNGFLPSQTNCSSGTLLMTFPLTAAGLWQMGLPVISCLSPSLSHSTIHLIWQSQFRGFDSRFLKINFHSIVSCYTATKSYTSTDE